MSAKIGVLEHGESCAPKRHVKRSMAQTLVRRSLAQWVGRFTIQMSPLLEYRPMPAGVYMATFYIPDNLPPRELPGLKFVLKTRSWELPAIAPADLEQPSRAVMRA